MKNEYFWFEEKRSCATSITAITPLTFTKVRLTAGDCFQSHWYSRSRPPRPKHKTVAHDCSIHDQIPVPTNGRLLRGGGWDKRHFFPPPLLYLHDTAKRITCLLLRLLVRWRPTSVAAPSAATIKGDFQREPQKRNDMEALFCCLFVVVFFKWSNSLKFNFCQCRVGDTGRLIKGAELLNTFHGDHKD